MVRIEITISAGVPSDRWAGLAAKRAKAEAARLGVSFAEASVFVQLPERGRCFIKNPGATALVAHG